MRIFGGLWRAASALAAIGSIAFGSVTASANPVLVFEPATGMVLYAEQPDRVWYPASLTKLMTAYLAFEAVKSGSLAWNTQVPLSDKARAQPETRIGLRKGIEITVDQAVRGLILRSANDFAVALAEKISGSEEAFAERMNETAKRLGMTRSHFVNPHGLPDPAHVSTARDMALLAMAILKEFPDESAIFASESVLIHRGTFFSQNDLLRTLVGGDGMKTGFTCGAGYNVVASATRDDRRVVAVVLGERGRLQRSTRASQLIEDGFAPKTGEDGSPLYKPVALTALAMDPAEAGTPPEVYQETRLRTCGRPLRVRPLVAKAAPAVDEAGNPLPAASVTASHRPTSVAAVPAGGATVGAAPRRVPVRQAKAVPGQAGPVQASPANPGQASHGQAGRVQANHVQAGVTLLPVAKRLPAQQKAAAPRPPISPDQASATAPAAKPKIAAPKSATPKAVAKVPVAQPQTAQPPAPKAAQQTAPAKHNPPRKAVAEKSDYGSWTRASTPP